MLPKTLIKGFNKGRLRNLLTLFFVALAAPTAILIWQAYGQLKWEAFHQYRGDAEELTQLIDARLNEMIRTADALSFADYTFLVVSGDPSANFVQRSRLSTFPVAEGLPSVLGYFQVDSDGKFSTPLLPPAGTKAANLGISDNEFEGRQQLAKEIQAVLADNKLVQSKADSSVRRNVGFSVASPTVAAEEEKDADAFEDYSQGVFDELSRSRQYSVDKVSELRLDAALQRKSEAVERELPKSQVIAGEVDDASTSAPFKVTLPPGRIVSTSLVVPATEMLTVSEPPSKSGESTSLMVAVFLPGTWRGSRQRSIYRVIFVP